LSLRAEHNGVDITAGSFEDDGEDDDDGSGDGSDDPDGPDDDKVGELNW
jgi:hypothetical protein